MHHAQNKDLYTKIKNLLDYIQVVDNDTKIKKDLYTRIKKSTTILNSSSR